MSLRWLARASLVPVAPLAMVLLVALSGCTHGSTSKQASPTQALTAAKHRLDTTTGVHLTLATDGLPSGVSGIESADGVATHDPAFKGTIKVLVNGLSATAPVVAVQGKVYARLPFTTKFVTIDPKDYGAPDPAALMSPTTGLSSLLTAAKGVTASGQQRVGGEVVSTYHGTLTGSTVQAVIPSAQSGGSFTAVFSIDQDHRLTKAVLTGPFYAKGGDVTYTIAFDQYGSHLSITAP